MKAMTPAYASRESKRLVKAMEKNHEALKSAESKAAVALRHAADAFDDYIKTKDDSDAAVAQAITFMTALDKNPYLDKNLPLHNGAYLRR